MVDLGFENSGRFRVVRGVEHVVNGEPVFTECVDSKKDGFYRTRYGYAVEHDGRIYCCCDSCFRLALRRLMSTRKPGRVGYHKRLVDNQDANFPKMEWVVDLLRQLYAGVAGTYSDFFTELEDHYDDPHTKKALRVQAMEEIETEGHLGGVWVKYITLAFKKFEWAKPGKYPRVYANLGIHSSLLGFRLMEMIKQEQAYHPLQVHGGTITFVKTPTRPLLREAFNNLIDPPGRFYSTVFSDDSCLAIRVGRDVKYYNLDISSCDASHYHQVFNAFVRIFPETLQDEVQKIVAQTMVDCKIFSQNGREFIQLRPQGPWLPSGSVLTTSLNTFVVFILIAHITSIENVTEASIVAKAEELGYILTVVPCETYHDLDFLKHFPALSVTGEIEPVLCLGVILRMSGTCKGDLPGRGPLKPRAEAFQKAILQGAVPYTSYQVIDNMKDKVRHADDIPIKRELEDLRWKVNFDDDSKVMVTIQDTEIYQRYRLTDVDIVDLLLFSRMGFEEFMTAPALSLILEKDYGLTCSTETCTEDNTIR
jgi:hypothetical protein